MSGEQALIGRWLTISAVLCLSLSTNLKSLLADQSINTGSDGVCQSVASGDDVQLVKPNKGYPYQGCIKTGADGICQTTAHTGNGQIIAVGKGQPNQPCIVAAPGHNLNTQPQGDDVRDEINKVITTGPDGICQTDKQGTDIQLIDKGKGKANSICIDTGPDGINLTWPAQGDDQVIIPVLQGAPNKPCVLAGADHLLQTALSGDDIVEGTPPDPIPTLSEWGIISAAVLMFLTASILMIRNGRHTRGTVT